MIWSMQIENLRHITNKQATHVLREENATIQALLQLKRKVMGFFLIMMRYVTGTKTNWWNMMPIVTSKTNKPSSLKVPSISSISAIDDATRLATPTGVYLKNIETIFALNCIWLEDLQYWKWSKATWKVVNNSGVPKWKHIGMERSRSGWAVSHVWNSEPHMKTTAAAGKFLISYILQDKVNGSSLVEPAETIYRYGFYFVIAILTEWQRYLPYKISQHDRQ